MCLPVGGRDLSGVVWHSSSSNSSRNSCADDPTAAAAGGGGGGSQLLITDGPPAAEGSRRVSGSSSSTADAVDWYAAAVQQYRGLVSCMAFDATGELLVAGLRDGSLCAWNSSMAASY